MKFYTKKETAEMLSVSVSSIDRYIREGRLRVHYLGGNGDPRIEENDIRRFMCMSTEMEREREPEADRFDGRLVEAAHYPERKTAKCRVKGRVIDSVPDEEVEERVLRLCTRYYERKARR